MKDKKPIPPPAARRFLRWFLRPDLEEEVSGDLDEKFFTTLMERSSFRARLNYWYQVFAYIRPFALKKSSPRINQYIMVNSYFTIGWRNLIKQKIYSAIKIGGFALGIAACLLISLYIQDELQYDKQYPAEVYRAYLRFTDKGETEKYAWLQAPFAKAIKEDYPEIEATGRYNSGELFGAGSGQIRRDDQADNTYEEGFAFVTQELVTILKLPMVYGNREQALNEPHTILITKRKADKYFPNENPVGKLMVVNNNTAEPLKVGGVIEDFPGTSHIQFDFLITLTEKEFWPGESNDWGATNYPTYVQLRPGTDVAALEKKFDKVITKYLVPLWIKAGRTNAEEMAKKGSFGLQPVSDIHFNAIGVEDKLNHGDIRFVWLFGGVASFILIIACINFINLSTAKSANRAKEVGIRKTIGSHRGNIISQFLTESLIFSVISFVLGMMIAWLALPYFNLLAAKSLVFPWHVWWFVPLILAASLFIGLLAGIYPSFYLSSFRPVQVLKGNLSLGSRNAATRSVLVVFQFTTSIILIIATVVIYRQVDYILHMKTGFEKEQVLMIQGTGTLKDKVNVFKEELLQLSQVKSTTLSEYLPIRGSKRNGNGFWIDGKQNEDPSVGAQIWRVDHDYIGTMGMKITAGRNFSKDIASDSDAVIINNKMAKELGLTDPVGKQIRNRSVMTVIGVVEDFNFESIRSEVDPLCMVLASSTGTVSVKLNTQDIAGTLSAIEKIWKNLSPHQPIRYSFLDESFRRMYDDVERMGDIFTTFAVLAIVVACLGLFALSAFMVEQRGKEISIRLVMGASLKSIFNMLTVNFVKLVLISLVLATPIAWYMMREWLQDFSYRTELTWDIFALAGVLAVLIALMTISYQSLRAGMARPIDGLRSE